MTLRQSSYVVLVVGLVSVVTLAMGGGKVKKTNVHGVAWHASFPEACQEAKRANKPILFLSMFGKLDEEMPCANARTLRATLFKDPEFKKLISNDVIPAWEMVRAVPKVEIDLGDGKKIKRTVRGNAVMYLCTPDGKVMDAFPGVYTPEDFMPMVKESIGKCQMSEQEIIAWHEANGKFPQSTRVTLSKSGTESPTLSLLGAKAVNGAFKMEQTTDPKRRRFYQAAYGLRDMSLTPLTSEEISWAVTGKPVAERTPEEVGQEILKSDSRQNVTNIRGVIHFWLASEKQLPTPDQARDTVLESILKIPYKDPFFGLKDIFIPGTPN
jgi:hypothetical protein